MYLSLYLENKYRNFIPKTRWKNEEIRKAHILNEVVIIFEPIKIIAKK